MSQNKKKRPIVANNLDDELTIVVVLDNRPGILYTLADEIQKAHAELSVSFLSYGCFVPNRARKDARMGRGEEDNISMPVIRGTLTMVVHGDFQDREDAAAAIENGRLGMPPTAEELKQQINIQKSLDRSSWELGFHLSTPDQPGIVYALAKTIAQHHSSIRTATATSDERFFDFDADIISPNENTALSLFAELTRICRNNRYLPPVRKCLLQRTMRIAA